MPLPSGLPERVEDAEPISRFLTSKGHFNAAAVKQAAFLPNRKNGRLSVARHSGSPLEESARIAREDFQLNAALGVAVVKAEAFREEALDFEADDTPPRHADVIGWPWSANDPEFGKSEQKLKAAALAQKATRHVFP